MPRKKNWKRCSKKKPHYPTKCEKCIERKKAREELKCLPDVPVMPVILPAKRNHRGPYMPVYKHPRRESVLTNSGCSQRTKPGHEGKDPVPVQPAIQDQTPAIVKPTAKELAKKSKLSFAQRLANLKTICQRASTLTSTSAHSHSRKCQRKPAQTSQPKHTFFVYRDGGQSLIPSSTVSSSSSHLQDAVPNDRLRTCLRKCDGMDYPVRNPLFIRRKRPQNQILNGVVTAIICDICYLSFNDADTMKSHRSKHYRKSRLQQIRPSVNQMNPTFAQERNNFSKRNLDTLQSHTRKCQSELSNVPKDTSRVQKRIGQKTQETSQRGHQITSSQPHIPQKTQQTSQRNQQMSSKQQDIGQKSQDTSNANKKTFECDIYDKDLCHRSIQVNGEMWYQCGYCSMKYKTKYGLTRHADVHTVEKPHVGSECSRNVKLQFSLKSYSKSHTRKSQSEFCNILLQDHPPGISEQLTSEMDGLISELYQQISEEKQILHRHHVIQPEQHQMSLTQNQVSQENGMLRMPEDILPEPRSAEQQDITQAQQLTSWRHHQIPSRQQQVTQETQQTSQSNHQIRSAEHTLAKRECIGQETQQTSQSNHQIRSGEQTSAEQRSTEQGSAEQGSAEQGSAEQGSAEQGSAEHTLAKRECIGQETQQTSQSNHQIRSGEQTSAEQRSTEQGSAEQGSAEQGSAEQGSAEHTLAKRECIGQETQQTSQREHQITSSQQQKMCYRENQTAHNQQEMVHVKQEILPYQEHMQQADPQILQVKQEVQWTPEVMLPTKQEIMQEQQCMLNYYQSMVYDQQPTQSQCQTQYSPQPTPWKQIQMTLPMIPECQAETMPSSRSEKELSHTLKTVSSTIPDEEVLYMVQ